MPNSSGEPEDEWAMLEKQEEEADAADANESSFYPTSLRSRLSFSELAELSVEDRFAELRDTEADYVADLKTMVMVYGRPAQKLQFLSKEERESIFCNTEQILLCNEALLEALRKPGKPEDVWAAAFLEIAPFFKIYATYAVNYLAALRTLELVRDRSEGFREFLNSSRARVETKNLQLEHFLIKPVQRLLKYPLFFKDFLKVVAEDHPSRPQLLKAEELVLSVSATVNSSGQITGNTMFQALLSSLGPRYLVMLAPHRRLRIRFLCVVSSAVRQFSALGFITSDLLVLCHRREKGCDKGGPLRVWMLAPLRDLLTGDDVLDGDPQYLVSQPLTSHFLPMRISPVARSAAGRGHDSDPSDAKHLQRDRAVSLNELSRLSVTGGDEELFRVEFESAEGLAVVQQILQSCSEQLERAEAEARRPDRRLKSIQIEEGVRDLVADLAEYRAQELAEHRKQSRSRSGSSMIRMLSGRSSLRETSKEPSVKTATTPRSQGQSPSSSGTPSGRSDAGGAENPGGSFSGGTSGTSSMFPSFRRNSSVTSAPSTPRMSPRMSFADRFEATSAKQTSWRRNRQASIPDMPVHVREQGVIDPASVPRGPNGDHETWELYD